MHGSNPRGSVTTGSVTSTPFSAAEKAVASAKSGAQTPFAHTNGLLAQLGTSLSHEVAKHHYNKAKVFPEGVAISEEPGCCRIG
ncbi:MAG: hypothetical protein K0R66_1066 [Gammaproteobacteria bacterium]|jgi:hypothetical protein|nr:hypothetical protein [Gammaproteobacteria bacterium]